MSNRIKRAIFPVAGMGTRFLPVTKSVPKEMLPLVDRPLIQYAVDEARAAGIEQIILVTAPGKASLEHYFDRAAALEAALEAKGSVGCLEDVMSTVLAPGKLATVRQVDPLGLGHAVWCARELCGDEPVAVLLPDDVISSQTPCLQQMVEAHAKCGGTMVATMRLPRAEVSSYGVIDPMRGISGGDAEPLVAVRGLVEKPAAADAPSDLAVIGRYILAPAVFDQLDQVRPGAGGEIQLTDAIAAAAAAGEPVFGFRFEGRRFDCGSKAGFIEASVAFALQRPELRDRLKAFLRRELHAPEGAVLAAE
ncbi:UTP--glucose-1-phosphate uridylyltransferase [Limibaculum sp. M0105]|uniref:UTP--glucose-1-phosphate uridylyltransferase n=1 Tax=Thermohalobaculum xanthum TaxID=2753746 RepID=A0A8J7M5P1_9RHOB|nr:UTP--glucose-1-phosphate uridylyltransferase [Thermohalobaculum xanthum]MBK0398738.1 UTP--glucose-1-phosphate uridylyltransferase [Thermohalobaculum xanthum]